MQSAVEAADAAETELRQLESQLKKLKDGLICSSCGAELSEEDRFCPSCGEPVDDDMAFCISCGYRLKR